MVGILKNWVNELGLRHQGVLVSAVRGADNASKEDSTKALIRVYRDVILVSFNDTPSSFIEKVNLNEVKERMEKVLKNFDHYQIHYILHLIHAAEIIGYKHPDISVSNLWLWFYYKFVSKLHMNPETEKQLDNRLLSCEKEFKEHDKASYLDIIFFEEIKDNIK